ncbi:MULTISPECIES: TRAP transporter substrate-binding protein [Neptuniibacter]|jgi:TRAP-type mannitol/chloroaromatic compound transport system substrate-binding protein|uniref:TRAP transporter substrate-binding protein n=1 Tax=Neptuniibacter TaxID=459520 RepID=UPI00082C18B8|nr:MULTISPECIES: TRAP transporter substrate-binding protein [Neptuniibacter]MDO6512901.1 TRAP transporter substrate-binding protein [Neptuniibacter sp. 2_MG-2023]MDO6592904.1 TRAP transporter substrate-binding protein [Neptuniibacter sp. 1_MG-2023]
MKKFAKSLISAAVLTAAVASVSAPVQAADKLLLKTPIAFGSHLPALGTPIVWVANQLKLVSDGNMRMKIYEPSKLVSPKEILDAVSSGKVNSGYATAGYWQGKIPAAALFSAVPFGPEAGEYMAWLYYGNGMTLYQEMYDTAGYNVKVMPCAIISPETSGWFAKPIEKPEDLKGLNMRFFGLGASVMEKLGVGTVQLPGGEIFGALEKGAIDASEFSQPAIDQRLGFHKIVKYNYFPGWHQQATIFELLINKDTWNGMSKGQQALLDTTCKASITNSIAEGEAMQFPVMEKAKENGVHIRYWNETMLSTFKTTWDEVAAEKSAEDPFFKKVWDDLSTFRKGYDLWEANAFLPRATK